VRQRVNIFIFILQNSQINRLRRIQKS